MLNILGFIPMNAGSIIRPGTDFHSDECMFHFIQGCPHLYSNRDIEKPIPKIILVQ